MVLGSADARLLPDETNDALHSTSQGNEVEDREGARWLIEALERNVD